MLKTGLLIDLGDDAPPVPSKRHSVGSVTKDGPKSRYENIEGNSPSLSILNLLKERVMHYIGRMIPYMHIVNVFKAKFLK